MHLTHKWMNPGKVSMVEDLRTYEKIEWSPLFTEQDVPDRIRNIQWRAYVGFRHGRSGLRYIVLEPTRGWDGVTWEDLTRAYETYAALERNRVEAEQRAEWRKQAALMAIGRFLRWLGEPL